MKTGKSADWFEANGRWYHVQRTDGNVYVDGALTVQGDGGSVAYQRCLPREIIEIIYKLVRKGM